MSGTCSVRWLTAIANRSLNQATKAITYYQSGLVVRPLKQEHQRNGAGTLLRQEAIHDILIWDLYLKKPSRPLTGHAEELERMSGLVLSTMKIYCWFQTLGPFRGAMRQTSSFPYRRNSWSTYQHLCQYLYFILSIDNHRRLMFADEKPTKEVMIYSKVRRNIMTGRIPNHSMEANSKIATASQLL